MWSICRFWWKTSSLLYMKVEKFILYFLLKNIKLFCHVALSSSLWYSVFNSMKLLFSTTIWLFDLISFKNWHIEIVTFVIYLKLVLPIPQPVFNFGIWGTRNFHSRGISVFAGEHPLFITLNRNKYRKNKNLQLQNI